MDPSLAPGYVPPNNGKDKAKKGHHWAEVQKAKAATTNGSDADNDASDSSTNSPATTPQIQPVAPQTQVSTSPAHGRVVIARHPRMASWRGARSALSDGEGIGGPADLEEVPVGVKRQALQLQDYAFPEHRLRTVMDGIEV
jgi:hypothetical protein